MVFVSLLLSIVRKGKPRLSVCSFRTALARGGWVSSEGTENLDEGLENIRACLGLS